MKGNSCQCFQGDQMNTKRFAYLSAGVFFFASSVSLVILMLMFIFVWQPIWTEGFKDFHTISGAITKLNETAKPASELAPEMLVEIKKITTSMNKIEINMNRINYSVDNMGRSMSGQLQMMNYEVDQMGDKFSPFGMMPFNW